MLDLLLASSGRRSGGGVLLGVLLRASHVRSLLAASSQRSGIHA